MATAKNAKTTAATTVKKAATKNESKKSATMEQIEKLEKALENTKNEDVVNLVPEEIKADIETKDAEIIAPDDQKDIDFDAEVKKIIETAEPSKEIKEQIEEFENGKNDFNEKLDKNPEEAEKLIEDELKRVDALKKKAETIKANIQKENKRTFRNSDFTNWWNGSSNLF